MNHAQQKRAARFKRQLRINSRRGDRRARVIDQHGGRGYGYLCVWLARKTQLNIAQVAALLEKESGFRHVWGHDPVRNPVKSPAGGNRPVTRRNYTAYKRFRKLGLGMQGCGLGQPTWWELQDEADRLGGCWRPKYAALVSCRHMAQQIHTYGLRIGAQHYNGAGAAASQYGRDYAALVNKWEARFRDAHCL